MKTRLLTGLALVLAASVPLAAQDGGQVVGGEASITNPNASTTQIDQITNRAIINWRDFSIGEGNQVLFNQPTSSAVALNRVVGQNPSAILGSLSANGQVFVLNPHGIVFGANSQVNVNGFVASTLALSNEDFMGGKYALTQDPSAPQSYVINQGTINATSFAALVAPLVENTGTISSPGGTVYLLASSEVVLDITGDGLIGYSIGNVGGGTVNIREDALSDVVRAVVNTDGLVEAGEIVENADGSVSLVGAGGTAVNSGTVTTEGGSIVVDAEGAAANYGVLDVSASAAGQIGGNVHLLGDRVGLMAGVISASGPAGGGTVLVGGDFQGNGTVRNSSNTYVDPSAVIDASATTLGGGGTVIVWSDGATDYQGSIIARGGPAGGNGGFAEVSGKGVLSFSGAVDLSAPSGVGGSLLLDPTDILIGVGADAGTTGFTPGVDQTESWSEDFPGLSFFDITPVTGSFAGITPGTAITLQATGDITVLPGPVWDVDISAGGPVTALTLQAGGDINIDNDVIAPSGAITLNADFDLSGTGGPPSDGVGAITQGAPGDVLFSGTGAVTLTAGSGITAEIVGPATVSATNSTSGAVSLTAAPGSALTVTGDNFGPGNFDVTTSGAGDPLTIGGAGIGAGGSITLTSDVLAVTGAVGSAGGLTVRPLTPGTTIGLSSAAGMLNLSAGEMGLLTTGGILEIGRSTAGAMTIADLGTIDLSAGGPIGSFSLVAGSITFSGPPTDSIKLPGGTDVSLSTFGGSISSPGLGEDIDSGGAGTLTLTTTAGAAGVFADPLRVSVGEIGLSTVAGEIALTNDFALNITGTVTSTTGSDILVGSAGILRLTASPAFVSAGGTVRLSAAGSSITDMNAGALDITASAAVLSSGIGGGIGASGNPIELDVASLEANGGTAGVFVANASPGLTIGGIDPGVLGVTTDGAGDISIRVAGGAAGLVVTEVISSPSGNITLSADDMDITAVIDAAGPGDVTLVQTTPGVAVDLGTNTPGSLGLVQAELDLITADQLRIGDPASAGSLFITSLTVQPAGVAEVHLRTAGSIVSQPGAGTDFTGTSLALTAGTGIGTSIDPIETSGALSLAFSNTTSGAVVLENTGALTVDVVDGIAPSVNLGGIVDLTALSPLTVSSPITASGNITLTATETGGADDLTIDANVTSTGGDVTLNSGDTVDVTAGNTVSAAGDILVNGSDADADDTGTITLDGDLTAGGRVTLDANAHTSGGGGGVTQGAGSTITASELLLTGEGAFDLDNSASNDIDTIAASLASTLAFTDVDGLSVGTVGATVGITAASVDLTTGVTGNLAVNDAIVSTVGDIRLTTGESGVPNSILVDDSVTSAGNVLMSTGDGIVVSGGTISAAGGLIDLRASQNDFGGGGGILQTGGTIGSGTEDLVLMAEDGIDVGSTGTLSVARLQAINVGIPVGLSPVGAVTIVNAGPLVLAAIDGVLSGNAVQNDAPGNVVDITAPTIDVQAPVVTAGTTTVTLTADQVDFTGGSIVAGGSVTLEPLTGGTAIDLGTDGGTGAFELTNADLSLIVSGGSLVVGNAAAGNITITSLIDQTTGGGWGTLSLITGGGIVDANAGLDLNVDNLAIRSVTGYSFAGPAADATLETSIATAGTLTFSFVNSASGPVLLENLGSLTIGSVDGVVTSINTGDTATTLTATSPVIFDMDTTSAPTLTATASLSALPDVDNVVINPGISVTVTGILSDLIFSAEDDIVVSAGALASATSGTIIFRSGFADSGDADGDITIAGALTGGDVELDLGTGTGNIATEVGAGLISGTTGLLLLGTGDFILSNGNTVADLAANVIGDITFVDSDGVNVGSVRGVDGIRTGGGDLDVNVTSGELSVANANAGADIDTGAGTILLSNDADSGRVTIGLAASITSANGGDPAIEIMGDRIDLSGTVVATGGGVVLFHQTTAGRFIDLGTGDVDAPTAGIGTLGLTDGELDLVTAGILRIGDPFSGDIGISGPISAPAGWSTLSLVTPLGILDGNPGLDLTVTNLAIRAVTGIPAAGGPLETVVSNLAFENNLGFGPNGSVVDILNTGALTIDTVDGIGVAVNDGGSFTSLVATSPLTFAIPTVSVGPIFAVAGETAAVGDDITVNPGILVMSTGGEVVFCAGDDVILAPGSAVVSLTSFVSLLSGGCPFPVGPNPPNPDVDGLGGIVLDGTVDAFTTIHLNAITGVVEGPTGSLIGSGADPDLLLTGSGLFDLDEPANNAVLEMAAFVAGEIRYTEAGAGAPLPNADGLLVIGAVVDPVGGLGLVTGVTSGSSPVTIQTDDLNIDTTLAPSAFIDAGAADVNLLPTTPGTPIDLGTAAFPTGGSLGLSDAELDTITTSGVLRIGSPVSGSISITATISAPTSPPDVGEWRTLSLITGGEVIDANAGPDILIEDPGSGVGGSLAIRSVTGIGDSAPFFTLDTTVGRLAFENTGAGDVSVFNVGPLADGILRIGDVDGIVLSSNAGGLVDVTAGLGLTNAIVVEHDITSFGDLDLTTLDVSDAPVFADDITVTTGLTLTSTTGDITLCAGDDIILEPLTTFSAAGAVNFLAACGDVDGGGTATVCDITSLSPVVMSGALVIFCGDNVAPTWTVSTFENPAGPVVDFNDIRVYGSVRATGGDLIFSAADDIDIDVLQVSPDLVPVAPPGGGGVAFTELSATGDLHLAAGHGIGGDGDAFGSIFHTSGTVTAAAGAGDLTALATRGIGLGPLAGGGTLDIGRLNAQNFDNGGGTSGAIVIDNTGALDLLDGIGPIASPFGQAVRNDGGGISITTTLDLETDALEVGGGIAGDVFASTVGDIFLESTGGLIGIVGGDTVDANGGSVTILASDATAAVSTVTVGGASLVEASVDVTITSADDGVSVGASIVRASSGAGAGPVGDVDITAAQNIFVVISTITALNGDTSLESTGGTVTVLGSTLNADDPGADDGVGNVSILASDATAAASGVAITDSFVRGERNVSVTSTDDTVGILRSLLLAEGVYPGNVTVLGAGAVSVTDSDGGTAAPPFLGLVAGDGNVSVTSGSSTVTFSGSTAEAADSTGGGTLGNITILADQQVTIDAGTTGLSDLVADGDISVTSTFAGVTIDDAFIAAAFGLSGFFPGNVTIMAPLDISIGVGALALPLALPPAPGLPVDITTAEGDVTITSGTGAVTLLDSYITAFDPFVFGTGIGNIAITGQAGVTIASSDPTAFPVLTLVDSDGNLTISAPGIGSTVRIWDSVLNSGSVPGIVEGDMLITADDDILISGDPAFNLGSDLSTDDGDITITSDDGEVRFVDSTVFAFTNAFAQGDITILADDVSGDGASAESVIFTDTLLFADDDIRIRVDNGDVELISTAGPYPAGSSLTATDDLVLEAEDDILVNGSLIADSGWLHADTDVDNLGGILQTDGVIDMLDSLTLIGSDISADAATFLATPNEFAIDLGNRTAGPSGFSVVTTERLEVFVQGGLSTVADITVDTTGFFFSVFGVLELEDLAGEVDDAGDGFAAIDGSPAGNSVTHPGGLTEIDLIDSFDFTEPAIDVLDDIVGNELVLRSEGDINIFDNITAPDIRFEADFEVDTDGGIEQSAGAITSTNLSMIASTHTAPAFADTGISLGRVGGTLDTDNLEAHIRAGSAADTFIDILNTGGALQLVDLVELPSYIGAGEDLLAGFTVVPPGSIGPDPTASITNPVGSVKIQSGGGSGTMTVGGVGPGGAIEVAFWLTLIADDGIAINDHIVANTDVGGTQRITLDGDADTGGAGGVIQASGTWITGDELAVRAGSPGIRLGAEGDDSAIRVASADLAVTSLGNDILFNNGRDLTLIDLPDASGSVPHSSIPFFTAGASVVNPGGNVEIRTVDHSRTNEVGGPTLTGVLSGLPAPDPVAGGLMTVVDDILLSGNLRLATVDFVVDDPLVGPSIGGFPINGSDHIWVLGTADILAGTGIGGDVTPSTVELFSGDGIRIEGASNIDAEFRIDLVSGNNGMDILGIPGPFLNDSDGVGAIFQHAGAGSIRTTDNTVGSGDIVLRSQGGITINELTARRLQATNSGIDAVSGGDITIFGTPAFGAGNLGGIELFDIDGLGFAINNAAGVFPTGPFNDITVILNPAPGLEGDLYVLGDVVTTADITLRDGDLDDDSEFIFVDSCLIGIAGVIELNTVNFPVPGLAMPVLGGPGTGTSVIFVGTPCVITYGPAAYVDIACDNDPSTNLNLYYDSSVFVTELTRIVLIAEGSIVIDGAVFESALGIIAIADWQFCDPDNLGGVYTTDPDGAGPLPEGELRSNDFQFQVGGYDAGLEAAILADFGATVTIPANVSLDVNTLSANPTTPTRFQVELRTVAPSPPPFVPPYPFIPDVPSDLIIRHRGDAEIVSGGIVFDPGATEGILNPIGGVSFSVVDPVSPGIIDRDITFSADVITSRQQDFTATGNLFIDDVSLIQSRTPIDIDPDGPLGPLPPNPPLGVGDDRITLTADSNGDGFGFLRHDVDFFTITPASVTAGELVAYAANGITLPNTFVGRFQGVNTVGGFAPVDATGVALATGDIFIHNTGDLELVNIDGFTDTVGGLPYSVLNGAAGGDIVVEAESDIRVLSPVIGANDIVLDADTAPGSDIFLYEQVTSVGSGTIDLFARANIVDDGVQTTSLATDGRILLEAELGSIGGLIEAPLGSGFLSTTTALSSYIDVELDGANGPGDLSATAAGDVLVQEVGAGIDIATSQLIDFSSSNGGQTLGLSSETGDVVVDADFGTGNDNVILTGGDVMIGASATVAALNRVTLVATANGVNAGTITQAAGVGAIQANQLVATAVDAISLSRTQVSELEATSATSSVSVDNVGDLSLTNITGGATSVSAATLASVTTTGDLNLVTLVSATDAVLSADGSINDGNGGANNISATTATLSGDAGIDVDTDIDTLTASSSAGSITVREAGDLALMTVAAPLGTVTLVLPAGTLSDGGVTSVSALAAILNVSGDIDVNTAVDSLTASAGGSITVSELDDLSSVNLSAPGDTVDLTAGGTVGDSDAAVDIAADVAIVDADAVGSASNPLQTDVDDLTVTTNDGDQYLSEADDLDDLDLSAGNGNIFLTAGGDVNDFSGDGTDVSAAAATIVATGFGALAPPARIETDVDSLTVDTSSADGNQGISEADDLTQVNLNAGDGRITLVAGGDVLDTDGATDFAASVLNVTADQFGTGADPIDTAVDDLVVTTLVGGQWIVEADRLNSLDLDSPTVVHLTAGDVIRDFDGGVDITATTAIIEAARFGNLGDPIEVDVDGLIVDTSAADGDQFILEVDGITDLDLGAGVGSIELTLSAGAIADADALVDVSAFSATLNAADGIGPISTSVDRLALDNTTSGDINVVNTGDVVLESATNAGGSVNVTVQSDLNVIGAVSGTSVTLTASGAVILNGAGVSATALGGAITIDALGGALQSFDTSYTAVDGGILLYGSQGVTLDTSGGDSILTTGLVDITSDLDLNVFLPIGSALARTGAVTLDALGAVVLDSDVFSSSTVDVFGGGQVELGGLIDATGSGVVSVTSSGASIVDVNGAGLNVFAGSARLTAATGVGSAVDPIELDVAALAGDGGNGGFHVTNAGALNISTVGPTAGVTVSGGNIGVSSAGPLTLTDAVTHSGSGDIALSGLSVTQNADVSASGGNVTVTALGGGIDMDAGTVTSGGSGDILYDAQAGDVDLGLLSTTGSVTVSATGAITDDNSGGPTTDTNIVANAVVLTAGTDIGPAGGASAIEVDAATLTATAGTGQIAISGSGTMDVLNASAGTTLLVQRLSGDLRVHTATAGDTINLITFAGDIWVDNVSSPAGTVTVSATGGAINELGNDVDVDLAAGGLGQVILVADFGIGNLGAIEVSGISVDANNVVSGDVNLASPDATFRLTTPFTANGSVTLTGAGDVIMLDVIATDTITITAGGEINESVDDPTADLTAPNVVLTAGSGIGVDGTTGQIDVAADTLTASVTGSGAINVNDVSGGLLVSSATTADGSITLNVAAGNLVLDTVTAPGNLVALSAPTGAILDANSAALNILADILSLTAGTSIGTAGDPIETDVRLLVGTSSGTAGLGGVYLANTGTLDIVGPVVEASPADISIDASGSLTVNAPVTTAGGTITLSSAGDVSVLAPVDSVGGTINLDSGAILVVGDTVSAVGGTVNLNAGTDISLGGDVTAAGVFADAGRDIIGVSGVVSGDTIVILQAERTIFLGEVASTGIPPTGQVILMARTGWILDANGASNNISSNFATLTAANGIGTGSDPINTDIDGLEASAGSGGVYLSNVSGAGLTIGHTAAGSGALNGVSSAGGDIVLSTTGDLTLDESVNAGFGDVSLSATGAIVDGNTGIDVIGGSISLSADTGIGSADALEISGDRLTATNVTSGGVRIEDTGDLIVDGATNTGGSLDISSSGSLTVAGVVTASGFLDLVAAGGNLTVQDANVTSTGSEVFLGATGDIFLLLDPATISGATNVFVDAGGNLVISGDGLAGTTELSAQNQLDLLAGGNVSIDGATLFADNSLSVNGAGNVTVDQSRLTSDGTLTLVAGGTLNITGDGIGGADYVLADDRITFSGSTGVNLISADIVSNFDEVSVNSGADATISNSFVLANQDALTVSTTGDLTVTDSSLISSDADLTLTAGGLLAVRGTNSFLYGSLNFGGTANVVISGATGVVLEGAFIVTDADDVTVTSGGNVSTDALTAIDSGNDVTINAGGSVSIRGDGVGGTPEVLAQGDINLDGTLDVALVDAEVDAGIQLVVSAGGNLTATTSDLQGSSAVSLDAGGNLTLNDTDVDSSFDVTLSAGGDLALIGDSNVDPSGSVTFTAGGSVLLANTSTLSPSGSVDLDVTGSLSVADSSQINPTGNVTATVGGNALLSGTSSIDPGGNVDLDIAGDLALTIDSTVGPSGNASISVGGNVLVDGTSNIDPSGDLDLNVTGDLSVPTGDLDASGSMTLTVGGDVLLGSNVNVHPTDLTVTAGGSITVDGSHLHPDDELALTAGSDVLVTNGADLFSDDDDVRISAGADLTVESSDLNADSTVDLVATGNISIDGSTVDSDFGSVFVTAGGTLTVDGSGINTNSSFSDDLTLQATGNLAVVNSDLEAGFGDLSITSGGDVTLVNSTAIAADSDGSVDVAAAGNLTIDESGIFSTDEDVTLTAGGSLTIRGLSSLIYATVLFGPGGDVILNAGQGILVDEGLLFTDDGGIEVTAGDNLDLVAADLDATGNRITLIAGGWIQAVAGGSIVADELILCATSGIWVPNADVNTLQAMNTASGTLTVYDIGDLDLVDLLGTGFAVFNAGGDIVIETGTGGPTGITVSDPIEATGNVTIDSDDSIIIDEDITSGDRIVLIADEAIDQTGGLIQGNDLILEADDFINLPDTQVNRVQAINTGSDDIFIQNDGTLVVTDILGAGYGVQNNNLDENNDTVIEVNDGDLIVELLVGYDDIELRTNNTGNVLVGSVTSVDDDVEIESAGDILEIGDDTTSDLTAFDSVDLDAAGAIGTQANPIEVDAQLQNGGSSDWSANGGDLNVTDVDGGLALDDVFAAGTARITALNGSLTINDIDALALEAVSVGGSITVTDLTGNLRVDADATGDILIDVQTGGLLLGLIDAGDTVTLMAGSALLPGDLAGSILDDNDVIPGALNVRSGGDATFSASGVVGLLTNCIEVEIGGNAFVTAGGSINGISIALCGTTGGGSPIVIVPGPGGATTFNGLEFLPALIRARASMNPMIDPRRTFDPILHYPLLDSHIDPQVIEDERDRPEEPQPGDEKPVDPSGARKSALDRLKELNKSLDQENPE